MKPGTKSRKFGLTIPTVNPCNDFIVDYLLRNKIKSDKQILCKSYLYNLAIESVRKYPLPLICQEQLAALEGFGDFFINQVGRLIKRHYTRGKMPTQKEMDEDDEAHFEVLRIKNKELQEKNKHNRMRVDHNRQLDSVSNLNSTTMLSNSESKAKSYKPKKNTEPYNILEVMLEMGAYENEVTKGAINEVLFNKGKEKIRLWYVLKQKFLDFDFIEVNPKSDDLIKLTKIGKEYIENYEENEKKKRKKKVSSSEEENNESDSDEVKNENELENSADIENDTKTQKSKISKSMPLVTMLSKMSSDLDLKKIAFPRGSKFESIDLLINNRNQDIEKIESLIEGYEDIGYELCDMELANFMWSTDGKVLLTMAFRIKRSEFDEEEFKTICLRSTAALCEDVYLIIEDDKINCKDEENEEKCKAEEDREEREESKNEENSKDDVEVFNLDLLLCYARASGFKILKTKSIDSTIQKVYEITNLLVKKAQIYEGSDRNKKILKKQVKEEEEEEQQSEVEIMRHLGPLEKVSKRLVLPYELSTITAEMLKCIPEFNQKVVKSILEKYSTLAIIFKKTQDSGTTKDKRFLLKSYVQIEKSMDESLNILIQILFYDEY